MSSLQRCYHYSVVITDRVFICHCQSKICNCVACVAVVRCHVAVVGVVELVPKKDVTIANLSVNLTNLATATSFSSTCILPLLMPIILKWSCCCCACM